MAIVGWDFDEHDEWNWPFSFSTFSRIRSGLHPSGLAPSAAAPSRLELKAFFDWLPAAQGSNR